MQIICATQQFLGYVVIISHRQSLFVFLIYLGRPDCVIILSYLQPVLQAKSRFFDNSFVCTKRSILFCLNITYNCPTFCTLSLFATFSSGRPYIPYAAGCCPSPAFLFFTGSGQLAISRSFASWKTYQTIPLPSPEHIWPKLQYEDSRLLISRESFFVSLQCHLVLPHDPSVEPQGRYHGDTIHKRLHHGTAVHGDQAIQQKQ